jgi:ABC-type uncharacterized transport system permease subunit
VITTIMLNWIVFWSAHTSSASAGRSDRRLSARGGPISDDIPAKLALIWGDPLFQGLTRLHLASLRSWSSLTLNRTSSASVRAVGRTRRPPAAGISVARNCFAMAIAGSAPGLAGA